MRRLLLLVNLAWLLLLLLFLRLYLGPPQGRGGRAVTDAVAVAGGMALTAGFSLACGCWVRRRLRDAAARLRHPAEDGAGAARQGPGLTPAEIDELVQSAEIVEEQQRAELVRVTSERDRWVEVLDHVSAAVLVTDAEGRVVLANRALSELFQAQRPVAGRLAVEVVRHAAVEEAMAQALASGSKVVREVTLPGVRERYLDLHVVPLVGNGVRGVVSAFYDITRLRQLERVRKDFVANVSHELRTPLTAIKGCAETLLDGALSDSQAGLRFVQVISSHGDRLARLLDDLLSLARLESEKLEVHLEECSLRRLSEGCAAAVGQLAQGKQIAVALDLPEDVQVRCDRKLIEQALINLLDNAIKYTADGGRVVVRALPASAGIARADGSPGRLLILQPGTGPEGRLAIEVEDTGMGIPSQDLGRVFERFYRVDKGRSRALGGTGLGLAIVRHVLETHGEGLYVLSELGHGSTFGFTLPVSSR